MPKALSTLTAALLAATGAPAQEAAPAPQEFETPYTLTTIELSRVPMGGGQQAFVAESFPLHAATEGPLAGLAGHCLYTGVGNDAVGTLRAAGTCVFRDALGNELWQSWEGSPEGDGDFAAKGAWIGGTGRFARASGDVTFEVNWVASPREGVNLHRGVRRGTLILPAS